MKLPNISQYIQTVGNPHGLTASLGEFEMERDIYGQVRVRAGNNAAVFKIGSPEHPKMLKCYIKPSENRRKVYDYISNSKDPLFVDSQLLKDEIYVYDSMGAGAFYDALLSTWVEGNTLEREIYIAVKEGDRERLGQLSTQFNRLALDILEREWAHGDIKPENIIVTSSGELQLIDYDALYAPSLENHPSIEIGTPAYQHPLRDSSHYSKSIDDYSIAIISVSLRALALEPTLYTKYNTTDNIILHPSEIINGSSDAHSEVLKLFAENSFHTTYRLTAMLNSPTIVIEHLSELLSGRQERQKRETQIEPDFQLFEHNRLWGYKNANGEIAIEPIYDSALEFREGLAVVQLGDSVQVIDVGGESVINNPKYEMIKSFSEGVAATKKREQWGLLNRDGEFTTPNSQLKNLRSLHCGVAAAQDTESNRWGYLDKSCDWIIPPKFEHAYSFRTDRAKVIYNGEAIYINKFGNQVDEL